MTDVETVKPADADLLRQIAAGFEGGDYCPKRLGNVIAARLDALADVLDQYERVKSRRGSTTDVDIDMGSAR